MFFSFLRHVSFQRSALREMNLAVHCETDFAIGLRYAWQSISAPGINCQWAIGISTADGK